MADARAMNAVIRNLTSSPLAVMRQVVAIAMDLCGAHSAGLAVLQDRTANLFHHPVMAGAWVPRADTTAPRVFSPYGVVLDQGTSQLFCRPQRYYHYLADAQPPVIEALLTPFWVEGRIVGALWVVLHDESRLFDAEDERRLTRLARYASAIYDIALARDDLSNGPPAPERLALGLGRLNEVLSSWQSTVVRGSIKPDKSRALSRREFEVVCLVAHGHTNQAIAEALGVNVKTIETYRARATDKRGFRDRADFVTYALTQGWLPGTSS